MKSSLILTAFVFCIAVSSLAQTGHITIPNQRTVPAKGYYSIGNNWKKLQVNPFPTSDTIITPIIVKGYYAIKGNNIRLAKKQVLLYKRYKPVISKGYYSIEKNAEKLSY